MGVARLLQLRMEMADILFVQIVWRQISPTTKPPLQWRESDIGSEIDRAFEDINILVVYVTSDK